MNRVALRILHVLPHAGGGVGTVLRALITAEVFSANGRCTHRVATLEHLNIKTRECLDTLGVEYMDCAANPALHAWVVEADVVLVHWWNHPLLMHLLAEGLPASRVVLWSHVNGYAVPQAFIPELFDAVDIAVLATEASLEAPVVRSLSPEARAKIRVVRSCAGIPPGATIPPRNGDSFRFGYLGTVESSKMHQDFLSYCAGAGLSSPCLVAGGSEHARLQEQAQQASLADQFQILGPVADPYQFLRTLHALAYPLTPEHYGTGEQVLIEAMAFGVVPVVLDNPPERALVQHNETGFVAKDGAEFSAYLLQLAEDPQCCRTMAANGHAFVMEHCAIERSLDAFQVIFEEAAGLAKTEHRLILAPHDGVCQESPFHLFLASCGNDEERAIALAMACGEYEGQVPPCFAFSTRGSPAHYLRMLGADSALERLCMVAEQACSCTAPLMRTG